MCRFIANDVPSGMFEEKLQPCGGEEFLAFWQASTSREATTEIISVP
jgi:hypothetical protein